MNQQFSFNKSHSNSYYDQLREHNIKMDAFQKVKDFEESLREKECVKKLYCEMKVGSQDVQIRLGVHNATKSIKGGGNRKKITEWSRKSRARCETHIRNVPEGAIGSFLTLTYPDEYTTDGKQVKKHLDLMIKQLKRYGLDSGIWFLEFQKRGAPHFHLFLPDYKSYLSEKIALSWCRIVGSGDSKHLDFHLGKLSGRHCYEKMHKPHAASYYASKYAIKCEQKEVPEEYQNVGRFWGYWGEMKPSWNFVHGRGGYSHSAAVCLIRNFKERWGGEANLVEGYWYSCTLKGAASELDELIEEVDWYPF